MLVCFHIFSFLLSSSIGTSLGNHQSGKGSSVDATIVAAGDRGAHCDLEPVKRGHPKYRVTFVGEVRFLVLFTVRFTNDPLRLKSRQEYQHIFKSVAVFYRALHTVSTSRYRLPVRRFIFDLFDIPLDQETVQQLADCGRTLVLGSEKMKPPTSAGRRRAMSVLFAAPKAHPSGSDEEEEGAAATKPTKKGNAPPVVCLEPRTMIKGFDGEEDESS
jgi:hypothetical protein